MMLALDARPGHVRARCAEGREAQRAPVGRPNGKLAPSQRKQRVMTAAAAVLQIAGADRAGAERRDREHRSALRVKREHAHVLALNAQTNAQRRRAMAIETHPRKRKRDLQRPRPRPVKRRERQRVKRRV